MRERHLVKEHIVGSPCSLAGRGEAQLLDGLALVGGVGGKVGGIKVCRRQMGGWLGWRRGGVIYGGGGGGVVGGGVGGDRVVGGARHPGAALPRVPVCRPVLVTGDR